LKLSGCVGIEVAVATTSYAVRNMDVVREHDNP
jgi:hypothetical protein